MMLMSIQNRISITLSPRMRKALELAAGLDGSTTASYATQLLTSAIKSDIKDDPTLYAKWVDLEKEALNNESWDNIVLPMISEEQQKDQLIPKGWFLAGDNPDGYVVGKDAKNTLRKQPSGFIRSKNPKVAGFGTLMQQVKIPTRYIGKKLRFTASVKTEDVKKWAGLWVRIDDADMKYLWFDNMEDRPIKGTTNWQKYQISFEVAEDSKTLNFGILLVGAGGVLINEVSLVSVDGTKTSILEDLDITIEF